MLKDYIAKYHNKEEYDYGTINNYSYLYMKNAIDKLIWESIIKSKFTNKDINNYLYSIKDIDKNDSFYDYLISLGNVLIEYKEQEYFIPLSSIPKRSPDNSSLDPINIEGSKDAFTENINDNIALIKKRIKTNNTCIYKEIIGNITLTDIAIIYLENKANKKIVNTIKKQLKKYKDKDIITIDDLNFILSNESFISVFETTSKPDLSCTSLLKGRIIVMADNLPVVIIIPSSFLEITEVKHDVNTPTLISIFNRLFIMLFFFTSVFSLGLVIVFTSHYPAILSTTFIANFQLTERGTTFSLVIEIIIMLGLFEFYRQISLRSPESLAQSIIVIFGGIFIGQNAIQSSIIGSMSILLSATSYVSTFALTNNQKLITSFSIMRVFILLLSYSLGIIGFLISSIVVIDYLASIKYFDKDYLYPIIPLSLKDLKNYFIAKKGTKHD